MRHQDTIASPSPHGFRTRSAEKTLTVGKPRVWTGPIELRHNYSRDYLRMGMDDRHDRIYERLADESEPAPTTAPAAQFTGDRASGLMASLMAEDIDATAILATPD